MANEVMIEMLRHHIRTQHVRRNKEALVTAKLSALNTALIFTNASQRSPEKSTKIIEGLIDELFDRTSSGPQQGAGGSTGGPVAEPGPS